jgi:hypothetical protein
MENNDKQKDLEISSPNVKRTGIIVVDKAIDIVKQYKSNFFVGVQAVVPDPPSEGSANPSTAKGFVTNKTDPAKGDLSKIIYIFVKPNQEEAEARLKNEIEDENDRNSLKDEATAIVIANTMVHEKEHVSNELKQGEGPSEQKEKEFEPKFKLLWEQMISKKKSASLSVNNLIKLSSFFEKVVNSN